MKKLAGTWLLADKDGKPTDQIASIIKVTAGGSVVHETLFPGQPHEMVSVYHRDGADLVMTHYCALGNQPRMKADPKSPANQIHFVDMIINHLTEHGVMSAALLYESPFTDLSPYGPDGLFSSDDVDALVAVLDHVRAAAVAA